MSCMRIVSYPAYAVHIDSMKIASILFNAANFLLVGLDAILNYEPFSFLWEVLLRHSVSSITGDYSLSPLPNAKNSIKWLLKIHPRFS